MKLIAATIAALALAVAAGSADAARFAPPNTNFAITGTMEFQTRSGTLHCPYTFWGKTNGKDLGGTATLSGATMCPQVVAAGMPWSFQPTIGHAARAMMSFILKGGDCGSADDGFILKNGAVHWGMQVYPACLRKGGSGKTSPVVSIFN